MFCIFFLLIRLFIKKDPIDKSFFIIVAAVVVVVAVKCYATGDFGAMMYLMVNIIDLAKPKSGAPV